MKFEQEIAKITKGIPDVLKEWNEDLTAREELIREERRRYCQAASRAGLPIKESGNGYEGKWKNLINQMTGEFGPKDLWNANGRSGSKQSVDNALHAALYRGEIERVRRGVYRRLLGG
jgi:hypothetical protein